MRYNFLLQYRQKKVTTIQITLLRGRDFTILENKAGYTATPVACGWAGAVMEKVNRAFGQEQSAQKAQKRQKSKLSAVPVEYMWVCDGERGTDLCLVSIEFECNGI